MMFSRPLAIAAPLCLAAWLFCGSPSAARATVLAYDGFAAGGSSPAPLGTYVSSPTDSNGINKNSILHQAPAVTGFSTANAWSIIGGDSAAASSVYPRILTTGLSYGSLPTQPGSVEIFRSSTSTAYEKHITRTTSVAVSDSIYVSALIRYNAARTAYVLLGRGSSYTFFGFNAGTQAEVGTGAVSSLTNNPATRTVRNNSAGETFAAASTHLVIFRLDSDGSYDLYIDPTHLNNELSNTAVLTGAAGSLPVASLTFLGFTANTPPGSSTIFDELRVSTTWAVPEPASLLLAAPGLVLLLNRRRRTA